MCQVLKVLSSLTVTVPSAVLLRANPDSISNSRVDAEVRGKSPVAEVPLVPLISLTLNAPPTGTQLGIITEPSAEVPLVPFKRYTFSVSVAKNTAPSSTVWLTS